VKEGAGTGIFRAWWQGVFRGFFAKTGCMNVVLCGQVVVDCVVDEGSGGGKIFVIESAGNSAARINGKAFTQQSIEHSLIADGITLTFAMSAKG
jgi:hypothetical protein